MHLASQQTHLVFKRSYAGRKVIHLADSAAVRDFWPLRHCLPSLQALVC
jgi:hypothetical protein